MSALEKTLNINNHTITIRPFNTSDSVEELTQLLHKSYKTLADDGMRFLASHQDDKITQDRISKGICLVALLNNKIIGTITLTTDKSITECNWYNKNNVARFNQFAVDPKQQKLSLGSQLLSIIEEYAYNNGIEELALDTSEKAKHLIDYYNKKGYRYVESIDWGNIVNYKSVVLSKRLKDFH